MPSENAIKIANDILDDLKGAGFYRDSEILAQYLEGKLVKTKNSADAKKIAVSIIDDLKDAGDYNDPKRLASFLDN